MARPRIAPSARSVPISFSVKPNLAEKIEEYSHQLRFSRSKFLAQAVTEAITKIELGVNLTDFDVRNFSDNQKVVQAINALQRPSPTDPVSPAVLENLKSAIELYELQNLVSSPDIKEIDSSEPSWTDKSDITFERVRKGLYTVFNHGTEIGQIEFDPDFKAWITSIDNDRDSHRTLKHAKEAILASWE